MLSKTQCFSPSFQASLSFFFFKMDEALHKKFAEYNYSKKQCQKMRISMLVVEFDSLRDVENK